MADVSTASSSFQDTSTDCAICLEPLDESSQEVIITLKCGHKWHFECLREQILTAQPNSTKRLLFTGCQCAKCGVICEHEKLENLTRTTDILRQKVDGMLEDQLALDAHDIWRQIRDANDDSQKQKILDHARQKYAFYLCRHCKEPYFGGTVECADSLMAEEESTEERLCVACAPQSQVSCQNPLQHGAFLMWKCRYCCQPSTHLCYGNIHFCNDCHKRNSQRVRQQQQNGSGSIRPPPLQAVPCKGSDCPFPKKQDQTHHSNGGNSKDSEQVYGCAWCQSSSLRRQAEQEPGSDNLLQNPSGENDLQGWNQLNRQIAWRVEDCELPFDNSGTTTNFVSSFLPCIMCQTLDLSQLLVRDEEEIQLELSALYMGRTDCPSVFQLQAILADERQRPLQRFSTQRLEAPPDYWERASLKVDLPHGRQSAKYLSFIIIGKDARFWQGNFGSKVACCSVRVLGDPLHLARVLRDGRPQQAQYRNIHAPRQQQHQRDLDNQNAQQRGGLDFFNAFLPIICLVIFAWLVHD